MMRRPVSLRSPLRIVRPSALFAVLLGAGTTMMFSLPSMAREGALAPLSREQTQATAPPRAHAPRVSTVAKATKSKHGKKAKRGSPTRDDGRISKKAAPSGGGARDAIERPPPDLNGGFEMQPIAGRTIDFEYDGRDAHAISLSYSGRVFVPDSVIAAAKPVPLVVFFHGLNKELVRHRWMGGGQEGDVRRIILSMIDAGEIPPVIVAGPGSVQPDAVSDGASFPVFDFDKFMDLTKASLGGVAEIDASRIIVTGHSGAGCSERGGILSPMRSAFTPHALISMDTCMGVGLADSLAAAPPSTHVVVTWQSASWDREFDAFKAQFKKSSAGHPANGGVLRSLEELPTQSHDATVGLTFKKYLPLLLR